MALLSNANSLLELAFGVNAVGLALGQRFKVAREAVVQELLRAVQRTDPAFNVTGADEDLFFQFAADSSPGLRWAALARPLPQALSLAAVLMSLLALVVSSVKPDREIPDQAVFWFAVVALVALPALYTVYQRFLDWVVATGTKRQTGSDERLRALRDRFHLVKKLVRGGHVIAEVGLRSIGQGDPISIWLMKRWTRNWAIRYSRSQRLDTADRPPNTQP